MYQRPWQLKNRMNALKKSDTAVKEELLVLVFLVTATVIILVPSLSNILKYSVLPISIGLLYRYDSFDYLIFPLGFLDNSIGTLFMGRLTILIFYLPFLFYKLFVGKRIILNGSYILVLFICLVYFVLAYPDYGNLSIKFMIIILCSMIIGEECISDHKRMDSLLTMLYLSALIPAIVLCFGLTGTEGATERTTGIGFSDPNYSSLICVIGLCVLLNLHFDKFYKKVFQATACFIVLIGIFRSGSRAGLLVAIGVVFLKILLMRGIAKKVKMIVAVAVVAVIGLFFINANVIKISNMDYIIARWEETWSAFSSGNIAYATAERSSISNAYMRYFATESALKQLFGFNVVGSQSLFIKIGRAGVTHNVFIDYLMAFGVIGSVIMFGLCFARLRRYYKLYRITNNLAYLAIVEIKVAMLVFGATLAMLQVHIWWFLFLI